MGILSSGIALGGVLGLLLGGWLEGTYGWRVAFMTVGVPGFICAVLVSRLVDPTRTPARLTVRSFLRDFEIGVLPLLRNLWPLIVGRGGRRRRGLVARPRLRRRLEGGYRGLQRGGGPGTRPDHPALGVPHAHRRRRRHGLRQRHQRRVRRHRARGPDGAAHADPGLHLLRGRDDLVRPQRHRRMGPDVREPGAGTELGGIGGAAGKVGAHRGNGGHAVRRRARRLAPPPLRDGAGDRRGARPAAGRAARALAAHDSRPGPVPGGIRAGVLLPVVVQRTDDGGDLRRGAVTDQCDRRRRLPALHPPRGRRDRAAAGGKPERPVRARPGGAVASGGGDRGGPHGARGDPDGGTGHASAGVGR